MGVGLQFQTVNQLQNASNKALVGEVGDGFSDGGEDWWRIVPSHGQDQPYCDEFGVVSWSGKDHCQLWGFTGSNAHAAKAIQQVNLEHLIGIATNVLEEGNTITTSRNRTEVVEKRWFPIMNAPLPQLPRPPHPSTMQVFDNPADDPECYPKVDDFMLALQDPGKLAAVSKKQSAAGTNDAVIGYPQLMRVLAPVQKTIHAKNSHLGVPKHPTELRRQMALSCERSRKR
jgi:hypothetical protein